jgi:hypothetical protein
MQRREIILGFLSAGLLVGPMVANATLTAVTGADGRQMVNDSTLNVTWGGYARQAKTLRSGALQMPRLGKGMI